MQPFQVTTANKKEEASSCLRGGEEAKEQTNQIQLHAVDYRKLTSAERKRQTRKFGQLRHRKRSLV